MTKARSSSGLGASFKLQGPRALHASAAAPESALNADKVKLSVKSEFAPGAARDEVSMVTADVALDDILEIEFETGEVLWVSGEDYLKRYVPAASRDASDGGALPVPTALQVLPSGMQSRGPVAWAIKALKVVGVDLAGVGAEKIAAWVEKPSSPTEKKPGPGLYQCGLVTDAFALNPVKARQFRGKQEKPFLVFLHGTASSTWGSFGDLWSDKRKKELEALIGAYGERVLGFEHASLTQSPIENALDLAQALPKGARLHLVTHSRGGLIGELLCRAGACGNGKSATDKGGEGTAAAEPFSPDELKLFEGDPASLELLQQLNKELKDKKFKIERVVRVACPALGTTLASRRLDRWLSVIGSVAGMAVPDTPLADFFKDIGDFIAAVIKKRTDPEELPGLAAMMPQSPVIKLVNWPATEVSGDLAVIAGDMEPDAVWAKLMTWVADRFYEGDHDLVVNTVSMSGGANRSGKALVSPHKGSNVNHFNYFINPDSANNLVQALTSETLDIAGFEPLEKPRVDIARTISRDTGTQKPVVFVIPGIMGTELIADGDRVWLDISDLIFGGLKELKIDASHVRPLQLISRFYGDLIEYLTQTHEVAPFPYDWRLPLEGEADRLADEVRWRFESARQHGQPVRFLAHSMGGLLARTMIAQHGGLWRDICQVPGSRLIMLGTPNGGSHSITELLVGQSSTFRKLALLDIRNDGKDLLNIISRFPGMLAMLPKDNREDYFSAQTWKHYFEAANKDWVQPTDDNLARAQKFRSLLDASPIDPEHMIYVAGSANVTVAEMHLDRSSREKKPTIKFLATTRGDGRVTWDSGIPQGIPTWYMDVEHGDLPAHEDGFQALQQLLEEGSTNRLADKPPVSRAAADLFEKPAAEEDLYPTEETLAAEVLGGGTRRHLSSRQQDPIVEVSVLHANLAFAGDPVAVGHYAGDTIISAEKQLDEALDGVLTRHLQLGLYPSEIGTNAIFVNPKLGENAKSTPKGAVVIGLGPVGHLSAATLAKGFCRAMLEFIVSWGQCRPTDGMADTGGDGRAFGVSTLLIGTGAGGISVSDSVFALLQGARNANRIIREADHGWRIGSLEFVELWEDQALNAVHALFDLEKHIEFGGSFKFGGTLHSHNSGLRRVRYQEPPGWWHRLQVLGGDTEGDGADGAIRFSSFTRQARSEVRILATQRDLVDQFIKQSIGTTQDNRALRRTLFELLMPHELKEQTPEQDNLVLIVDEEAARYPWELLQDPKETVGLDEQPPFSVRHGLVRQLESREFRHAVRGATREAAFVVGDPKSAFPELKGAQIEAEEVSRTLRSKGFETSPLVRASTSQIVRELFSQPYRILHLAGHGVYNYRGMKATECDACGQALSSEESKRKSGQRETLTGMIIGDDVVLSPMEVRQMSHVPELVFINCCHLGYIEDAKNEQPSRRKISSVYNRIAANVATEFIRMGVRAVVAAGWAVDDAAAKTFASTFYQRLLDGAPFGEAVLEARYATYVNHLGKNTWGAYQCYGDPDYRLKLNRTELIFETETEKTADEVPKFASQSETIARLNNVTANLKTKATVDLESTQQELLGIAGWLESNRTSWLSNGAVCAALGRAFGEAGLFDKSIEYYERGLRAEDGELTLHDFEQLANLQVRHGVSQEARDEDLKSIDAGICRLEWLISGADATETLAGLSTPAALGPTVERLCLVGSGYKRKAWNSRADRAKALERMGHNYREGFKLAQSHGLFNPYPLLNWLTADIARSWLPGKEKVNAKTQATITKWIGTAQGELKNAFASSKDFWDAVMVVDANLLDALFKERLEDKRIDAIARDYKAAAKLASPRELASVLDQIDFFLAMAEKNEPVFNALKRLHRDLEKISG